MDNEEAPPAPQSSGEGGSSKKKVETKAPGFKEIALALGAVGNFILQCVNIANLTIGKEEFGEIEKEMQVGRGMAYASSGLGAVHSPVIMYKERQLTKEGAFREALNVVREQQGRLKDQNDTLSAEIDDLQSEVDRMKDVELALRELADTQGSQLDQLMGLIAENKEINAGLRDALKAEVLEKVIEMVLAIDKDGSFTIENKEVDYLIVSMGNIEGITFDKSMFKKEVVQCGGNVDEVIMMIKAMILGSSGEGDEEMKTDCEIKVDMDPDEYFNKQKRNNNLGGIRR